MFDPLAGIYLVAAGVSGVVAMMFLPVAVSVVHGHRKHAAWLGFGMCLIGSAGLLRGLWGWGSRSIAYMEQSHEILERLIWLPMLATIALLIGYAVIMRIAAIPLGMLCSVRSCVVMTSALMALWIVGSLSPWIVRALT